MIRNINMHPLIKTFRDAKPFPHIVIENFLENDVAHKIAGEFPAFNSNVWYSYENQIEIKRACNNWNAFGPATYRLMTTLNSHRVLHWFSGLTCCRLYADPGLNGAGMHTHRAGGKLNVHLDYSIHPKLGLERRLNLLIYFTPEWEIEWGGALGFYSDQTTLVKKVYPFFNRAVIFDTTNSWHGLPDPINCPVGVRRNSLAVYYLCERRANADKRGRALFAPSEEQVGDPVVLNLIKERAEVAA